MKGVFRLCKKISGKGCVPIVIVVKDVFRLCRRISGEGCVPFM